MFVRQNSEIIMYVPHTLSHLYILVHEIKTTH